MQNSAFDFKYTPNAEDDLKELIANKSKKVAMKAVVKSLRLMASNLKHPSLNTHKYDEMEGPNGEEAPYETWSPRGCTFWKNGLCELHSLGLKPSQGKLAHHSLSENDCDEIGEFMNESWEKGKGDKVIEKWKEINKGIE